MTVTTPPRTHVCPPDHAHAATQKITCYAHHGCRCPGCIDLHSAYNSWRNHMTRTDQPLIIPATGTHRRIQALMCLGWSMADIARLLGDRGSNVRRIMRSPTITRRFATRFARVYDELSWQVPAPTTQYRRASITRAKGIAARNGWHPPLAWNDIDNDPAPLTVRRAA